jgi:hypothetical protein
MNLTPKQYHQWQRIEDYSVVLASLHRPQRMQLLSVIDHQLGSKHSDLAVVYASRNNLGGYRYNHREKRRMRDEERRFFSSLTQDQKRILLFDMQRQLRDYR